MIRIVIADDHRIVIEGLRHILASQDNLSIVAEVEDGAKLVMALKSSLDVDLLIMDMSMPGKSGLELLKQVRRLRPFLPVLVLSMHPESLYGVRALRGGATGYLTKDSDARELLKAVQNVAAGRHYISEGLASQLVFNAQRPAGEEKSALSDREVQVLQLIASGVAIGDIADQLCLSVKTVSTHKANIQGKLGVSSTAHLIHYAIQKKLVEPLEMIAGNEAY